jgi:membrane-associated protein
MSFWDLLNPETIITYGGLLLIVIIVFAENGVIFGFFLPGDSLIFLSGLICASKPHLLKVDITTLLLSMFLAAVLGSLLGYITGRRIGPRLFQRKDSVVFKKKYLEMTQSFYNKHGGKTLILGRFLPIIRTFAPMLAGVIKVEFRIFMLFNIVGGALWIGSLGLVGYLLGSRFPMVSQYIEVIVIAFVAITSLIVLRTYLKEKKQLKVRKKEEAEQGTN